MRIDEAFFGAESELGEGGFVTLQCKLFIYTMIHENVQHKSSAHIMRKVEEFG